MHRHVERSEAERDIPSQKLYNLQIFSIFELKTILIMKLFRYILPIVFLFLSFLVVGQTITTYYPKVDRQSRDYIHIMKVVVEPNQVYVVFRYNVLGNDKVGMGSQTSLRCGSFRL